MQNRKPRLEPLSDVDVPQSKFPKMGGLHTFVMFYILVQSVLYIIFEVILPTSLIERQFC